MVLGGVMRRTAAQSSRTMAQGMAVARQSQQRRMATSFSDQSLIPRMPSKTSILVFTGIAVVIPTVVYAGATAAKNLVAYVEDNEIWRPEDEDD